MSRPYRNLTLNILDELHKKSPLTFEELYRTCGKGIKYKEFYNTLYRLESGGLIEKSKVSGDLQAQITPDGKTLLIRTRPNKDGVWKLVIFDIPEKHKYVRNVLRAKLKALHFKKWQNSIWVSPYELDEEIEEEFKELGKKYFVRLIKVKDINYTEDLEKMFT